MKAVLNYLPVIALFVGGWMILNGILHDVFVLKSEHGKKYDRELLRLLMDGHILITCGIMQIISFTGIRANENWAYNMLQGIMHQAADLLHNNLSVYGIHRNNYPEFNPFTSFNH